ncbi:MAG: hypothetical protein JWP76_1527, partial [Dactylosporangium sp.]|nr:hypothetical protein [Dactylosporangium sp.]
MLDPQRAHEEGFLAHPHHLLPVYREVVDDGSSRGTRSLSVHAAGGLQTRILLDRGMDLGATWFAGVPVSWTSTVGEAPPGRVDADQGWLDGWAGGLLTTCGLRNVGSPSEGHGQHGSFTDLAASDVAVHRRWLPDGQAEVEITGTLSDATALGAELRVYRSIALRTGTGQVTVTDRTVNCGQSTEQAPILYHVNFGYPLVSADSEVQGDVVESLPNGPGAAAVDGDGWRRMGDPTRDEADVIFEHRLPAGVTRPEFRVTGPGVGLAVRVSWDAATMPRLHAWRRRLAGSYVMSLEP